MRNNRELPETSDSSLTLTCSANTKEENRAHELTKKNREKIAREKEQHAQKEADRWQKYKEKKAR